MRTLALSLAGCSVADVLPNTASLTPETYARAAVAQNEQQKTLNCGFSEGTVWSDDYASHRRWATDKTPQRRQQEHDSREARLAECRR